MRLLLIAAALALTPPAIAQMVQATPERPAEVAPAATASFDLRDGWCQKYAAWFVARLPAEGAAPSDVRATQRIENEMNSCKPDPQEYERQTTAELESITETEAG
jgi:hypothetical protein